MTRLVVTSDLVLRNLKVRSLDVESKELTWEIGDSQAEPLDYTFEVLRSESPGGPFEVISPPFTDRYIFVDRRLQAGDKYVTYWYKLKATKKVSGESFESELASQTPEPDLIAQYIRRMEMTYFTQIVGRACWLFKRRVFGPRCTSCWNPTLGKRTVDRCLDCFGTGMLRGYHNPIEVFVQIDPGQKTVQQVPQQIAQFVSTSARLSFYPNVSPGDVVVEAENKRWRVQTVQQSERLRAPIKQELTLKQLEEKDIEYRLPINLEVALRDIQPSPVRMFENASDINSTIDNRHSQAIEGFMTYPRLTERTPR